MMTEIIQMINCTQKYKITKFENAIANLSAKSPKLPDFQALLTELRHCFIILFYYKCNKQGEEQNIIEVSDFIFFQC